MTLGYTGYFDFYSRGPYAAYLVEHQLLGTNDVRLVHAAQPAGEFPDPPMPEYFLYVALRGASKLSFDWGCGRWTGCWHKDDVSIAPPYSETAIHVSEPHDFLALSLPASFISSAVDELTGSPRSDLGVLHTTAFRDPSIVNLIRRFWRGTDRNAWSELSEDCFLFAIVQALASRMGLRTPSEHELDDDRLSRVTAYIQENPGEKFRLAQLAAQSGLSPMHFARQFRRRTGVSPHQYVLQQRLTRLRGLLKTTRHPLAELAYDGRFLKGYRDVSGALSARGGGAVL
jgi:AraC family transcriptional regulator